MSEFTEKVNTLVGQMTQVDGKWQLPEDAAEGLDEPTLVAVTAERRYRDTQSAFTKSQQEVKRQTAIAEGLQEHALQTGGTLTTAQAAELHQLKTSDPDAWRAKLNEYETAASDSLKTTLEEIKQTSSDKSEVEVRGEQMAAWSESTGLTLNDDVIANDLPPRYMAQLSSGAITFEQFLDEAGKFLKAEKVIKGASDSADDDTKNLSNVAGGSEPSNEAQEGDFEASYENTLF